MNPATPYADAETASAGARDSAFNVSGPGVPLAFAKVGDVGTVVNIKGNDKTRQFLLELGFTPGNQVRVVAESGGNVILDVKGAKIALDKTMATKIQYCPSS